LNLPAARSLRAGLVSLSVTWCCCPPARSSARTWTRGVGQAPMGAAASVRPPNRDLPGFSPDPRDACRPKAKP